MMISSNIWCEFQDDAYYFYCTSVSFSSLAPAAINNDITKDDPLAASCNGDEEFYTWILCK